MSTTITLYTYNILEDGTLTVTGTPDTGYPESRLYDRCISLYWKDTVEEAKTFEIDQGSTSIQSVDFLAIAKHNFSGKTLTWEYSTDGGTTGVWTAATTSWLQADNNQIIKTTTSPINKQYWRVTVSATTNPKCSEIFMSAGNTFEILQNPEPVGTERDNVQWNRTIGGIERATKFGEVRQQWNYTMFLGTTSLTDFRNAMNKLGDYSKPFYLKDHEGNYWLVRLLEPPSWDFMHRTHTIVGVSVIEML